MVLSTIIKKRSGRKPRTVSLSIHPLVTLEEWVGAVQIAIMEDTLMPSQAARALAQIYSDPQALCFYQQACADELFLSEVFAVVGKRAKQLSVA